MASLWYLCASLLAGSWSPILPLRLPWASANACRLSKHAASQGRCRGTPFALIAKTTMVDCISHLRTIECIRSRLAFPSKYAPRFKFLSASSSVMSTCMCPHKSILHGPLSRTVLARYLVWRALSVTAHLTYEQLSTCLRLAHQPLETTTPTSSFTIYHPNGNSTPSLLHLSHPPTSVHPPTCDMYALSPSARDRRLSSSVHHYHPSTQASASLA